MNSKLISSYSRISSLSRTTSILSNSNLDTTHDRLKSLEQQRRSHIEALQSGVLVEQAAIATELSRLMERATEEERKRGEEEGKRKEIETELFELSAGLFGQANTTVAEERIARVLARGEWRSAKCSSLHSRNKPRSLRAPCGFSKRRGTGSNVRPANCTGSSRLSSVIGQATGDYGLGKYHTSSMLRFLSTCARWFPQAPLHPPIPLLTLPFLVQLDTKDS